MNLRLSYSMKVARACIALAAAYALALQVLLASTLAAGMAMAPADTAILCYGNGDTSGGQQPSHSPAGSADCVLSCAQGLSAAAILPPDTSSALISAMGRPLEPGPAADAIVSPRLSPKLAQGPPQNA